MKSYNDSFNSWIGKEDITQNIPCKINYHTENKVNIDLDLSNYALKVWHNVNQQLNKADQAKLKSNVDS